MIQNEKGRNRHIAIYIYQRPWKLERSAWWWIWMHENEMPKSIWRQCRDPGDRGVQCYTHPGGIEWLLGWVLASSIFRSLGTGHWQYEYRARAEYRCALDQCSPNRGSGLTSKSQPPPYFLDHGSREAKENRFIVGDAWGWLSLPQDLFFKGFTGKGQRLWSTTPKTIFFSGGKM